MSFPERPMLERRESMLVQVARAGANSGGVSGIVSRASQWVVDSVCLPPKNDERKRAAIRKRWRKVIRFVIVGIRLGRGVADEHLDLEEEIDSDDENEQADLWSNRLKLGVLRVVDTGAQALFSAVCEYPGQFLSMGVIMSYQIAISSQPRPWPGSSKVLMTIGMGVYRGFLPWAAGFFLRRLSARVPTIIETLTGNPLPRWRRNLVNVVSASVCVVPMILCEQAWIRQLIPCQPLSIERVSRNGLFGIPWWAVALRGLNETTSQTIDAVSMWRYYLPASHPSADRRNLWESIAATPPFFPRFVLMPLIQFPLPDFTWNTAQWKMQIGALINGYVVGFLVSLPLRTVFAMARARVLGTVLEDADAHLQRKLEHAKKHEAQVRARIDTTYLPETSATDESSSSSLPPAAPRMMRQATMEIKQAAAVGLQSKIDALRQRIATFADKSVTVDSGRVEIVADRTNLLITLTDISRVPAVKILRGNLRVKFTDEEGMDAGGLMRDYMHEMGQVLSHCSRLLAPGPDSALLPVKQDPTQQDWKRELFATGRLMAMAITANAPLDISFSICVYKVLLGERITMQDVARLDPQFAELRIANLLKSGGVAVLEEMLCDHLTFVSVPEEEELILGGKNVRVTEHNKQQYVRLLIEYYLVGRCRKELAVLVEGFHDVIPKSVLRTSPPLRALDLELMVAGLPGIDVVDWRANCEGSLMNNDANRNLRENFWDYVATMSVETRAKLLAFTCGSSRVPGGGFANMKPKFNISVEGSTDHLPSAHTCINQLVLPRYSTKAKLARMLDKALEYNIGFGVI